MNRNYASHDRAEAKTLQIGRPGTRGRGGAGELRRLWSGWAAMTPFGEAQLRPRNVKNFDAGTINVPI